MHLRVTGRGVYAVNGKHKAKVKKKSQPYLISRLYILSPEHSSELNVYIQLPTWHHEKQDTGTSNLTCTKLTPYLKLPLLQLPQSWINTTTLLLHCHGGKGGHRPPHILLPNLPHADQQQTLLVPPPSSQHPPPPLHRAVSSWQVRPSYPCSLSIYSSGNCQNRLSKPKMDFHHSSVWNDLHRNLVSSCLSSFTSDHLFSLLYLPTRLPTRSATSSLLLTPLHSPVFLWFSDCASPFHQEVHTPWFPRR